MKKLSVFLSILAFLITTNVFSQKITPNPTVDKDCSDETSALPITAVITGLGKEKVTLVTFQYATTLFKPWIRLDSKTFLTTDKSNAKLQILDWGIITDDEDDPFYSMNFNEKYFTKSRTLYDLYMVFPAIPDNAKLVNIQEPGKDGFFWQGIHINNATTEDLSKSSPGYPQSDGFNPTGSGTGFAINADGYIATCHHVIANSSVIKVRGINGDFEKTYDAKIVSIDEKNDLAILKVADATFSAVPYNLEAIVSDVGEDVFVLGYPQTQHLGEELKLTTGVISSRSGYRGDITTYQISAQVLPGNSGCPLFNNDGKVIGVVNAKYIEPNVSYAVKLSYLQSLIDNAKINLRQPVSNTIAGKSLAEKVKTVRNYIYIIEVQ